MTTSDLEELLEAGRETPRIEYKGPCEWDINKFAKDILALANLEYGGYIIIGMEEIATGYKRRGVLEEHIKTFQINTMRDQFSSFADPSVDFSVEFISDRNKLKFVVIIVYEFKQIPVICIKDSIDTKAFTIYYRNTDKKVESGSISNYHDLRDLIERAVLKIKERWVDLGLIKNDFQEKLSKELEELE